jgi:AmiR/NasT family two-component response regulator
VLPIDVERANAELIQLWLAAEGWDIAYSRQSDHGVAIVVIEIAFPRREDRQRVHALSRARPDVPVVVLSPTFFPDVPGQGRVAHELGATAVLATPLQRERLVAVVRDLLGATR